MTANRLGQFYRQVIGCIAGTLEERERESLAIQKMIRDRLNQPADG